MKVEGSPVYCPRCVCSDRASTFPGADLFSPGPHFPFLSPADTEMLRLGKLCRSAPIYVAGKTPSADSQARPAIDDDSEAYAPDELGRANTSATYSCRFLSPGFKCSTS